MWNALFAFHICMASLPASFKMLLIGLGDGSDFGQLVHLQIALGPPLGSCHMPPSA
jgi:hypothetical protein